MISFGFHSFLLIQFTIWEICFSSTEVRNLSAYVGYVFEATITMDEKVTLPSWIYWVNETLIGLPLENNLGEQLLLSSATGQEYKITVKNSNPWWSKLSTVDNMDNENYESEMFLAALTFSNDAFLSLSIEKKIQLIMDIKNIMYIKFPIVIMSLQTVNKSITFLTRSATTNSINKSLVLLWSIGKDYIFNSSLKSLQNFENRFKNGPLDINQIKIQQWFVGFLRRQKKISRIYYRRSINNAEIVAFIEGSGSIPMKKANELIKRTRNNTNNTEVNNSKTLIKSRPSIYNQLLPIKMHALQIMNFVIPENAFIEKQPKSPLKIKTFTNEDKIISNDPTKWISYNQNELTIRINPKLTDIGETCLKICAYNVMGGHICQNLSISVSPPPPQNHQIFVSKHHKDYVIKYPVPLAWFNRFGVRKQNDVLIVNATGNSPFDWNENGNLEILDVASMEGKLIEINLLTLIKNESKIYIHLTLPVVAINRQKLATGPLYRSVFKFREEIQSDRKPVFNLTDTWKLLKDLEDYVVKLLKISNIKIQIFTPIKSPLFFDKIQGNKENSLIFDWFFYNEMAISTFCTNPKLDLLDQQLLFRSFSYFFMVNLTVLENRFGGICSYTAESNPVTKDLSDISEIQITTMSAVDLKLAAESEIINKTFPNFQYPNFTVTSEIPFKSYIFRRTSLDHNSIKEMRLETSSGIENEPWIALSASNDFLYGLPLKKHVRESAYKFRFIIKLKNSQTQFKVTFEVAVVHFDLKTISMNHKIKLSIKTEKVKIDVHYHWKLITQLDKYVRDNCETANDCGKDVALWDVDSIQAADNPSSSSVSVEISYLSLLSKNNQICPKLSLIRFHEKYINTAINSKETTPNFALKQLFPISGLGEVIGCQIILIGICQGVKLQPPDLGQITVYTMIPFYESLQKFRVFYNSTVRFSIDSGNPYKNKLMYNEWISVNEDSTALIGLALHGHAKSDPYLVELVVHSNTIKVHQIMSPRIAIRVKRLMEHELFISFFQMPNHQIIINIQPMTRINTKNNNEKNNFLFFKTLFSSIMDQYFRSDCIRTGFTSNILPFPPCGANILYRRITNSENMDMITFKFNLIRELTFIKPIDSSSGNAGNGLKNSCPVDKLTKIERSLIGENGSPNKLGILPSVNDYFLKSKVGKLIDIKFEYLGTCSQQQQQRNSKIEILDEINRKVSHPTLKKVNDDSRQMFLMATIVPTCSFIIISLCVGLMVACCLQKRNQKFIRSMNSHFSSAEFAMRGGTSPIILAGEYQHSYMPPSRPLILPHEKPPVSPPDYIAENNSILINDEDA